MNKNNYWSICLYPLFLATLDSCTYVQFTDQELQDELDVLAKRAIAKFKFPKISLAYAYDSTIEEVELPIVERVTCGYYFVNDVTDREIAVLVAWMKVFLLEQQLSRERNYQNLYADKNVKAFSSGALISSIEKAYTTMRNAARKDEEDYSRINEQGKPAIGDINV